MTTEPPPEPLPPEPPPASPHRRALRWAAGYAAWSAAVLTCFRFGQMRSALGSDLCGVWGCYPPLEAMLAMHAVWTLALVPLALAAGRLRPRLARRLSPTLLLLATAGVVWLAWRESPWSEVGSRFPTGRHFGRRLGMSILASVDYPIVGLAATAAIGRLIRRPGETPPAGDGFAGRQADEVVADRANPVP